MKAPRNRLSRLLLLLILAGLASRASKVSAGVGVWTTNGPYGGDVRALVVNPADPATLYAGTSGGGVFKSTNRGTTWTAVNTGLTGTDVLSLALDPANPATLYAGTWIAGVFKSTNSGGTWTAVNAGLNDQYDRVVNVLAIDPSAPATLYAGTWGGVFKSTNGGATWTAINAGLTSTAVDALAIDPANAGTLYAGASSGVFKSTDGGGSWTTINVGLTKPASGVHALAIDPTSPGTLYAGTWGGGVFRSTNGGGTWTAINAGLFNAGLTPSGVTTLAIDPTTPATTVYAGTWGGGVFRSTNGGGTWTAINAGLISPYEFIGVYVVALDPSAPANLYAGMLGGGVFRSNSAGGSWTATNTGLTEAGVQALALDSSAPATLYAGTSRGGVYKSNDGGGSWAALHTLYSRLQALAADPSTPDTVYAGTASSDFYYEYPGVSKSTDGGASWKDSLAGSVYALVIDPSTPTTIYAGTGVFRSPGGGSGGSGVFKSNNGGANWTAIQTGLLFGSDTSVRALAVDPSNPSTLYAGMDHGGGAFKSTDGGGSWSAINAGLTGTDVQALAVGPSAPKAVYAGTDRGVFKSTNGGATWAAASTGLTNLGVQAIVIDPTAPATLYAGTLGGGVFRSTDSGGTWAAFNMGLPSLNVTALALDPTGTILYASLASGGVWQLTAPTTGTITALLPASARASGANGAFYTTNVAVANTGSASASFTLKFLGNGQDGSNGPERSFELDPGKSTTFVDVLGSVFDQTSSFGAIRITSNASALDIVSVTSTPGFGGTFGQAVPAISFADLIPAGSSRSILYVREGDGFRSNLILASGSFVSTDVDVALVSPAGSTLATKTYSLPPNGMTQVNRVVRDMGVAGPVTGARLVLSSSTPGAAFTGVASVIDEATNDPTTMPALPASVSGPAPYTWLLPASAHSSGASGAFYTTNVAVANVGAAPAFFTMTFLGGNGSAGHWDYLRQGTEQSFNLEAGKSAVYFDVLATVFNETSDYGALRITSNTSTLNIVSVTTTPGFGGTFGQSLSAVPSSDLIPAGSPRSILYIREGDGFRSNLVLASNASVPTTIDAALVSPAGETLASKSYSVPSNGMTQINRVVRDMGVSGSITGARLVLSSSTPGAAFTAFASVIDEATNDPTAVEAK